MGRKMYDSYIHHSFWSSGPRLLLYKPFLFNILFRFTPKTNGMQATIMVFYVYIMQRHCQLRYWVMVTVFLNVVSTGRGSYFNPIYEWSSSSSSSILSRRCCFLFFVFFLQNVRAFPCYRTIWLEIWRKRRSHPVRRKCAFSHDKARNDVHVDNNQNI